MPPLTVSAVHVWKIPLGVPGDDISGLRDLLASDELDRASRFHFERDARRFVVARGSVRLILASYTGSGARELQFRYSSYGKPDLASPASNVRFSVSHSGDLALLAVARGRQVGVDLEWIKEDVEVERLAERYFSIAERDALSRLSSEKKVPAFFRGWTCKEAFLKAEGAGLSRSLSSFDVDMVVGQPARLLGTRPDATEARRWFLHELGIAKGFAAAVAVEGAISKLNTFQYGQN